MESAVERYKKRRRKRLEARYDGALEWITLKNGVHVPVKEGKAVGGPVKGAEFYVIDKYTPANGKKLGDRRGQIEAKGGRVPYDELTAFNKEAFNSIMNETGYSEKEARKLHTTLMEYLGGDYGKFTEGKRKEEEKVIDDGLARMGAYDGPIYRGMSFPGIENGISQFEGIEVGDELSMKSVSSWSSDIDAARDFSEIDRPGMDSVLLVCGNNKSGVGVQHISKFRDSEAEVLAPSKGKWKVTGKKVFSKYDMANQLIKEYEEMAEKSPRAKSLLNILRNQVKINRPSFEKTKCVVLEVDEV